MLLQILLKNRCYFKHSIHKGKAHPMNKEAANDSCSWKIPVPKEKSTNYSKILERYLSRSSFYSTVANSMPATLLRMNYFTSIFL